VGARADRTTLLVATGAGWLAFVVYVATLAPTVHDGDSPELTLAALELGVAHPTGYPLYTLLGHAWSRLCAVGDPAWRLNLLSAVFAALSVGLLAHVAARVSRRPVAGWLAGLLFAFAPAVWSQATIAEVYALHALVVVAVIGSLASIDQEPDGRGLRRAALTLGLGLTHHGMTALLLPPAALAAWRRAGPPLGLREAARLGALLAAPLLLYAYLPLAASREPAVAWGNPVTPAAFWYHVSGGQYRGFLELPLIASLPQRLGLHGADLAEQFGAWLLPLAALGVWRLARARPALLAWTSLAYATTLGYAFCYQIVDLGPYFLPAFAIAALWIAVGASALLEAVSSGRAALRAAVAIVALAPGVSLLGNLPAQDRSRDFGPHDRALAALAVAPASALLLTQGPTGYAPVYASVAEGVRPDVDVIDMFLRLRPRYRPELERVRRLRPSPSLPRDLAVAAAAVRARPGSVLLWPDAPDADWGSVGLVRIRGGVVDRLATTPPELRSSDAPPRTAMTRFGDAVEFAGARIEPPAVEAGGLVRVRYFWRRLGSGPGPRLDVLAVLGDAEGDLVTGVDGTAAFREMHPLAQGVPLESLGAGELFVETLDLLVPRDAPPGSHALWVALRSGDDLLPTDAGGGFAPAAALEIRASGARLWTLPTPPERRSHARSH
jgi:4-amino-4-deoxy-L-arabinose transferase-like glycosyltransferase